MFNQDLTNRLQRRFDLVFACDQKRGIGKTNSIPWNLKAEISHFRKLTSSTAKSAPESESPSESESTWQNAVIMGRRTWESLPKKYRPLPNRINIVLTRNYDYQLPATVLRFSDLDQALASLATAAVKRVFVIGGADVFKQAMAHKSCGLLYLTEIMQTFDCDTFLPDFSGVFTLQESSEKQSENGVDYYYKVYRPKQETK